MKSWRWWVALLPVVLVAILITIVQMICGFCSWLFDELALWSTRSEHFMIRARHTFTSHARNFVWKK